jgi:hypothetical protein
MTSARTSARAAAAAAATAALVAATFASGASSAAAHERDHEHGSRQGHHHAKGLAAARKATASYRDIANAKAAGFGELRDAAGIACIDNPAGGMGVHYVNGARIDDVLDPRLPEVLVYEPRANGSMRLVALEYVIFASAWTGDRSPRLFGQSFEYMPGQDEANPNRYGLPAFWELHAWVWKHNPNGLFDDWNPRVTCP